VEKTNEGVAYMPGKTNKATFNLHTDVLAVYE